MDSYNSPSTKPLYRGTQIVWYILGVIEVLLIFRIILKILDANSYAGFTSFIYTITNPLASPFLRVFGVTQIQGSIVEWTSFLAIFVYWVVAIAIINLFLIGKTVSTPEAEKRLDRQGM